MLILVKILVYPLSVLPLGILRIVLLPFKWLIKYIIRYREKVVRKNLQIAFPDEDEGFYRRTLFAFYDNLYAIILESIKGFTISEAEAARRMRVLNPSLIDTYAAQNRSIILMISHFNNWEWTPLACVSQIEHQIAAIYQPLKNEAFNTWIKENRSRTGVIMMSTKETKNFYASNKLCVANAFIADQSPSKNGSGEWVDFFGRKTLFLAGAAVHAIQQNHPLVFVNIQRVKDAYYTIELEMIEANPSTSNVHSIIQKYASLIEKQVRENPGSYLWSHNRWKHAFTDASEKK